MVNFLVKYKLWFLLLVILTLILSCLNISSIKFNTDFSLFLSDNDPEYTFYKNLKSEIKDGESILILGVENKKSVLDSDFLKKVNKLRDSIKRTKNIKEVNGLTNLSYPYNSLFGLIELPYFQFNDSSDVNYSRHKIYNDFDITQHFVNKEGTVLLLWIELKEELKSNEIKDVLCTINKIRSNFSKYNTFLWGKTYTKEALNKITKNETEKTTIAALLFLIIALCLLYKKKAAVICSILIVIVSFIIFTGGIGYFDRPFGLMSNLFPAIFIIVGISDVIHLSIKYTIEIEKGKSPKTGLYNTLKEIGLAIFITSFTTAIGFFTLYLSPMKALRDFGLEAGIGVILTFVIVLILSPIIFTISKKGNLFSIRTGFILFANNILSYANKLSKYPKAVLIFVLIIISIAFYGISIINTNNFQFLIPEKTELKTNYSFFEKELKGSRTFEIVLIARNGNKLNTPQTLNKIYKIHKYLDSLPYLNYIKSPIIYYKMLARTYTPNKQFNDSLFLSSKEIKKYENIFNSKSKLKYLFNEKKTYLKLTAQIKDYGRKDIEKINETILNHVNTLLDTTKVHVKITGLDHLFDRTHEQRINNMMYGLGLAILIVALVLGLVFKNLMITVIALILNIIPLIIGAGVMGFTNLELRSGTSIIFTLAFVIAVDDTIHLLSKFQWERKQGKSINDAIELSIRECGLAILATNFILIGTFFVLMFSGFEEIFTLGFITGIIILITLATDLILAPILITKWFKPYL